MKKNLHPKVLSTEVTSLDRSKFVFESTLSQIIMTSSMDSHPAWNQNNRNIITTNEHAKRISGFFDEEVMSEFASAQEKKK